MDTEVSYSLISLFFVRVYSNLSMNPSIIFHLT